MYDMKELIDTAMSKLKKGVMDGSGPKHASDRVQLDPGDMGVIWTAEGFRPADGLDLYSSKYTCPRVGRAWKNTATDRVMRDVRCDEPGSVERFAVSPEHDARGSAAFFRTSQPSAAERQYPHHPMRRTYGETITALDPQPPIPPVPLPASIWALAHGVAVHQIDPSDEDDVDALFDAVRGFIMGAVDDAVEEPDEGEDACGCEDYSCLFGDDEDWAGAETSAEIARHVLEHGLVGHTDVPYAEVVQTLDTLSSWASGENMTKAEGRFTIVPGVELVVRPSEFEDEDDEGYGGVNGTMPPLHALPDTEETVAAMSERILDEITRECEYDALAARRGSKMPHSVYVPLPVFAHMKANTGPTSRLQPPQSSLMSSTLYDTYTRLAIFPSRDARADFYFTYYE